MFYCRSEGERAQPETSGRVQTEPDQKRAWGRLSEEKKKAKRPRTNPERSKRSK